MEGVTSLQVSADGNSGYHGSPACDSASLKRNSKIQFSGSLFTKADSLPVGRNASLSHSVPAGEKEGEPAPAGKGGMAYCKEGNRCRRPVSNRYDALTSRDFKSRASANSATPAKAPTRPLEHCRHRFLPHNVPIIAQRGRFVKSFLKKT